MRERGVLPSLRPLLIIVLSLRYNLLIVRTIEDTPTDLFTIRKKYKHQATHSSHSNRISAGVGAQLLTS